MKRLGGSRVAGLLLATTLALVVGPGPASAKHFGGPICGSQAGDHEGVAAARAAVAERCDCAGARSHGRYLACVIEVLKERVGTGSLRKPCTDDVLFCTRRSTCGLPGFVTCCRTDSAGGTECLLKHGAGRCRAPSGGSACVGTVPSCCDACGPGGCSSGTTTTTVAATTTTSIAATTTTTVAATTTTSIAATTTTTVATTTTTSIAATTTTTIAATTTTSIAATTTTTVAATTTTSIAATTTTTVAATTTTSIAATTTTTVAATTTTSIAATTTTTVAATTTTSVAATTTTTAVTTTSTTAPASTTTTTTVTTTIATTTTTMAELCAPIVVGSPIAGTYLLQGTTGEKRCTTNSASNRFGTCNSDANCGNTAGSCMNLPWVTADGQIMPFPTGTATTFTVNAAGTFPACAHDLCIPCGNPNAACAGIPGCEVAGNPNSCVPRGTQGCCDKPGFIVPTFFINILGGLCSRVDQYDCGVGIINTSNPQTGDLEVTKKGDTSDPGPDCTYGTPDDVAKPCNSLAAGQGGDYAGKIVTTYGNGSADANGIQYRLQTPELSTTWMDLQSPGGTCTQGSTFDDGEGLVSQILIKAEPTTAGATGQFTDQNGDHCSRVGSGFTSAAPDGPITVPGGASGPARPQPYDGSAGSVAAAVSEVFSGFGSPIHDIGFVAITANLPAAVVSPVACSCTPQPGCPE